MLDQKMGQMIPMLPVSDTIKRIIIVDLFILLEYEKINIRPQNSKYRIFSMFCCYFWNTMITQIVPSLKAHLRNTLRNPSFSS